MVTPVDGRQLPQLCLDINGEQGLSARDDAQVPDDLDGSTLILQFDFPRAGHSDNSILYAMVDINDIDDNLINPALRIKVARVLSGPPSAYVVLKTSR